MGKTLTPLVTRRLARSKAAASISNNPAAPTNPPTTPPTNPPTNCDTLQNPSQGPRRLRDRNPSLTHKIAQMHLTLAPIYPLHIPMGPPHEAFPRTVLHYWLLTEDEIDAFASYYHQVERSEWSGLYPASMGWDQGFLARPAHENGSRAAGTGKSGGEPLGGSPGGVINVNGQMIPAPGWGMPSEEDGGEARRSRGELNAVERLAIKRRMVGKFIGLRGCETPVWEMEAKVRWVDGKVRREIEDERTRDTMYRRGRKWV